MKDMLHMGLFLFVIAAIAGVLLAFTESLTAPLILENQKRIEELARREVLPAASSFKENSYFDASASQTFNYSTGIASGGEIVGMVMKVAPKGFAGPIDMMIGINGEGKVNGFKVLSLKETPGLGTKLTSAAFAQPFQKLIGENPAPVFKVKKDGGNVDGITAATISSRAFCAGVREALELSQKIRSQASAAPSFPPDVPALMNASATAAGGNQ